MSDNTVVVRIENASTRIPRKYKMGFALATLGVVIIQLLFPVWKLAYRDLSPSASGPILERPYTEHLLSRSLIIQPPIINSSVIPKIAHSNDLSNLSSTIDWAATLGALFLSILYIGIGAYGVCDGKPDRTLRHKRLLQFLSVSAIIVIGGSAMLCFSAWKNRLNPQTMWRQVRSR